MKVRYHVDGHLSATVQEVVEREVRFLDARLATFEDDLKSLDVTVRHQPRDDTFVAKLVLRLPSRTIAVTGSGPWRPAALRDAFDDLRDRLEEHLAKLRGEPAQRRGRATAHDIVGIATTETGVPG
jgi:ribosome-associated translation inhibitor RaiA